MPDNLQAIETYLRKFIGKVRRDLHTKEVDYRIVIQVGGERPVRLEMFNFELREWHTTQRFDNLMQLERFLEKAGKTRKEFQADLAAAAKQELHDGEDDDT